MYLERHSSLTTYVRIIDNEWMRRVGSEKRRWVVRVLSYDSYEYVPTRVWYGMYI